MKILISTTSFGEYDSMPFDLLKANNIEYELNPYKRTLKPEEVVALASTVEGIIAGTEKLAKKTLKQLNNVRVISRVGTGIDNVDLEAAKEMAIKVFNTPDAPTAAVAELTLGLMLDCLREISKADRSIRSGQWKKKMGFLLSKKRVGIIGGGRIGRAVAKLALAFGAKVLIYDIAAVQTDPEIKIVGFDELIDSSDIVTLHVPGSKSGDYLMSSQVINKMKPGAFLINAARGGLVDEEALYQALKIGRLTGAGLDTFGEEPYKGKLAELDNVVLTSHIGSYAREARIEMEKQAVRNLLNGLEVRS